MIRVLQYIPAFDFGGIESFVLDVNDYLKDKVHFTYLVEKDINKELQEKIKFLGSDIIRIPNLTKEGIFKHIFAINKIIKDGKFDVLHVHGCNKRFFAMFFAKIYKVKKRIYHVHSSRIEGNKLIEKIGIKINILCSNYLVACSKLSAQKMLGKKSKKTIIIESKINLSKFLFSEKGRKKIRKKFNIQEDETLIGTIGRLVDVKNQEFLFYVLNECLKVNNKMKLMIVGDGYLESKLKKKAREMKINDNVIFTGKQTDTQDYYSAMDVFCLPSYSEGYPVTLIEAQANGLQCIVSSYITKEIDATGEIKFLDINLNNTSEWVNEIKINRRYNKIKSLTEAGFDIKDSVKKLYAIYR